MWKINHNCVNLNRRCQLKLVWICALMSPLCIPSFSSIGVCIHILWPKMQSMLKNKEDIKKINLKFCSLYLLQSWYVDSPSSGASLQQICLNSGKRSQSYIHGCENYILCLPVNILTVWCSGFLGCMTHYHVSWLGYLCKTE